MVEERAEEEGGKKFHGNCPPLSPHPRKGPLSTSASPPFKKKARDLPDLSNCHSCGLRFPSKSRTLESQWRIVLLCEECLSRIRSAAACSYCFSEFPNGAEIETILNCGQCSCCVHVSCIPHQRGYVSLSDLDPDSFTCVDCSALPRYRSRNPSCFEIPFSNSVSRVSLEDLVRDTSSAAEKKANLAAKAKEKALKKAEAARHAAELARNALDVVIVAEPLRSDASVVADEELALQLHRSMNGSQRISRSSRTTNSDSSDLKKVRGSCKKVEFCTEDMAFFESMDCNSSIGKEQKKEFGGQSETSPMLMLVKEELESCSAKVVNSSGDDNSFGSVFISCQKAIESNSNMVVGEDPTEPQQKDRCCSPDRYVKKYSKRNSSSKGMTNMKESQLVPCWQISSKTSTFADAPYLSTAVPMHPSPYSSLSGCQS